MCVTVLSLSSVCLPLCPLSLFVFCCGVSVPKNMFAHHCVLLSVTLCACHCVCYSVSLSLGSLSLFMSLTLWVCLYLSLCVTVSVLLCVTIYPGVTVLLTTQATGGRVGPTGARAGAQPIPPSPAMGQAGRLFAVPAPGKHQDPEPKGHLPHLRPCPSACPGLVCTRAHGQCPQTGDVPRPSPQPSQVPALVRPCLSVCVCLSGCLLLCVCVCLSGRLLVFLFLSVPTSRHSFSVASPFSRMTLVIILSLSLYL